MDYYSLIIRYAIVATVTLIITGLLNNFLKSSKPERNEGNSILEMPKLYLYLSISLFIGFALYEYAGLIRNEMNLSLGLRTTYSLFGLVLCFGGINTLLLYKRHKVAYNSDWINQISWLGKEKTINWNDIIIVSFSSFSSSLKIETENDKIFIHEHIIGYKSFSEQLKLKTGLTK